MKTMKKFLCWILLSVMLVISLPLRTFAAELPGGDTSQVEKIPVKVIECIYENNNPDISTIQTRFVDASVAVNHVDEGMLITFKVILNDIASDIGVKNIEIKRKVWWGWQTVVVSDGSILHGGEAMSCELLYSGAVQGETYKITCTFVGNVDEYRELDGDSGEFTFNF